MVKVFIDLEMNWISKEHPEVRRELRKEIIQVGAVKLNEQLQEIGSFNEYVHPDYSTTMDRNVEKLTGITFDMLTDADRLEPVLRRFAAWCGSDLRGGDLRGGDLRRGDLRRGDLRGGDFEIYSWSDSDLLQLRRELNLKGLLDFEDFERLEGRWHDYQKEFGDLFPFENQISLTNAVSFAGLDFEGRAHDALNDARSTAALYVMTQDPERFKEFEEKVLNFLRPKNFTLGDMFDFSFFT